VTVLVPEDLPDDIRRLSLSPRERGASTVYSASASLSDGKFVFEDVPPGDYRLSSWGRSTTQMDVVVSGSLVVRYDPVVMDALRVVVSDPAGAIAASGLRDGDLVVGVDGTEFENTTQINALMSLAQTKPKATLTVLRGTTRFDLEVDVSKLWRNREAGGGFQPAPR
jgi:S1-C subfamily serine protease